MCKNINRYALSNAVLNQNNMLSVKQIGNKMH